MKKLSEMKKRKRPPIIRFFVNELSTNKFLKRYKVVGDCWVWTGSIRKNGYGSFFIKSKFVLAHRYSYVLFKGEISDNLVIDHVCKNRACVNPKHLELVTSKENVIRGVSPCGLNAKKTHCKYGHEFTKENIINYPKFKNKSYRACRICMKNHYINKNKLRIFKNGKYVGMLGAAK